MPARMDFASDNTAPVHPEIMSALVAANESHQLGYGDDTCTSKAIEKFKELFGADTEVFFVFNGTGANTLSVAAVCRSFNSVICSGGAHISVDECSSIEKFVGCKLTLLPSADGKVRPEQLPPLLNRIGIEHTAQPNIISITQPTEMGALYTTNEIQELADFAHSHSMHLHMDGARIANACASLGIGLKEGTKDLGVDILSFGGTKNGLMYGEAAVIFRPELANGFKYFRKQSTQLASKMRYISAQFDRYLTDDFWLKNASHANNMAKLLAEKLTTVPGVQLLNNVECNSLFIKIPAESVSELQKLFYFWVWNHEDSVIRFLTSFCTTEAAIDELVSAVRQCVTAAARK